MKKRINLRLILIAGIAVIVTMVCMTGIYYKLFQGQVRKDLQEIDALQQALRTRLSATISNYGYKAALDEVLVTKVVLQ